MSDFNALGDLLAGVQGNEPLPLSFDEVEEILEFPLPEAARTSISWWRPGSKHAVWADHGWLAQPRPSAQLVTFRRVSSGKISPPTPVRSVPRLYLLDEPPESVDWDRYDAWNEAVAQEFFDGSRAHRPVYIDMEEEAIDAIASRVGDIDSPDQAFVSAMRETLTLESGFSTFSRHINRMRVWNSGDRESTPPFLAILALFALVAEHMQEGDGFAADNYMGRLGDIVGLDKADGHGRDRLKTHFRSQSHDLWDALNNWLEQNEGSLGLQTARVFDWRVHVGIPISQALVKQADRERLPNLFIKWGLQPGQEVAPRDMARVLDDWVPSSNLSPYMKTLWKSKSEARQRVAEVVCVELAAWDGSFIDAGVEAHRSTPLHLAARTRSFPSLRLELSLTARASDRLPAGPYRPDTDSEPTATALGGSDLGLVVPEGRDTWVGVKGEGDLSIPDLLALSIRFRHDSGAEMQRQSRSVVVLTQKDDTPLLVESTRVELGRQQALLVHKGVEEDVSTLLNEHARPGFRALQSDELPGLPEGWAYLDRVELATVPDTENPELGPLIPVAWTAVGLQGGLQLPGQATWHSSRPPHVAVSAVDLKTAVIVLIDEEPAGGRSAQTIDLDGADYVDLGPLDLTDGDFMLELKKSAGSRSALMTRRLKLRSASTAGVDSQRDVVMGRQIETASWACGAAPASESEAPRLRDAHLTDMDAVPCLEPEVCHLGLSLKTAHSNDWQHEDDWGPTADPKSRTAATGCISGAHYWLIESIGHATKPQRDMAAQCKLCGLTKWFPARPPKRRTQALPGARLGKGDAGHSGSAIEAVRVSTDDSVDHDLLLDALSYSQGGSWASFVKLCGQMSEKPWFARETARNLAALGYIDLVLDPVGLSPRQWAMTPPTIASLPAAPVGILCGFRSDALVENVKSIVKELGGTILFEDQPNGPRRITIHDLDDDLAGVAEVIAEDTGLDVRFSDDSAGRIAAHLPHLTDVAQTLNRFTAPVGTSAEFYTAESNKWVAAESAHSPGAYRFQTRPVAYGVRSIVSEGLVRADNRWSKWLGAMASGQEMLAYDPSAETLITRMGAQLPGMYERAAVLCSGFLPRRYDDGTMRYQDIPIHLASMLASTLTESRT